jgi:hypothetical protein
MKKLSQEIEKSLAITLGKKKARKPYRKSELVKYGNLADLTAGVGGTHIDPGHATQTKKGTG